MLSSIQLCKWYSKLLHPGVLINQLLATLNLGPYMKYNLLQLNDRIILFRIMWNEPFNTLVESSNIAVACLCALVIIARICLQQYSISTYVHKISHGHINYLSYHIVRGSHFRANVHTVSSRRIHLVCIMCYSSPITEQIWVR